MDVICPSAFDSLARIWSTLHVNLRLAIRDPEVAYLRRVIFEIDDDLVAQLLAQKLDRVCSSSADAGVARTGSHVLYSVDGRTQRTRLTHGCADDTGMMGVGSRFGAALIGLGPMQSLLWPAQSGRLVEVRLLEVLKEDAGDTSVFRARAPCAFG